jgi:hypothetical protein
MLIVVDRVRARGIGHPPFTRGIAAIHPTE